MDAAVLVHPQVRFVMRGPGAIEIFYVEIVVSGPSCHPVCGRDIEEWASKSNIRGVSEANNNGTESQPRQQLQGR